jgi:hypothetical protein|tara:strand:- start:3086 stop:3238 length:153 start_codon:yes stop_codon:yes gene_type:complete
MRVIAKNSASRSSHKLAAEKNDNIKNNAEKAVFLEKTIARELAISQNENT